MIDKKNLLFILKLTLKDQYKGEPNYEGYVVIGAGLPRTGTASMRCALSMLLNGPVYHMYEVGKNLRNGIGGLQSTCPLVFRFWLLDHVIYLELRRSN